MMNFQDRQRLKMFNMMKDFQTEKQIEMKMVASAL